MTAEVLLLDLSGRSVRLWAERETLRFRAPAGTLTVDDKRLLKENKDELMFLLKGADFGPATWGPLSYGQLALWYLQQLAPDSTNYNLFQVFEVDGPLNTDALESALTAVIQRHGALRAVFVSGRGDPFQVVVDSMPHQLSLIDLSALGNDERYKKVDRLLESERQRPFNLAREAPLRTLLIKLASDSHLFILTVHHIAFDGYSSAIMLNELLALYGAEADGRPHSLPDTPFQYADFARWQRRHLSDERLESDRAYWRKQLAGLATLQLPSDRPRTLSQSFQSGRQPFELPGPLTKELAALGRQGGATLFMVLLAAFKVLLYRYTGQEDLAVGSPLAGRLRAEFEDVIGYFVNTLVLRSDMSGEPSFRAFLGRVRDTTLEALRHQGLPFVKLVQELKPERVPGSNPLFQVMFAFDDKRAPQVSSSGLTFKPLEEWIQAAVLELELVLWPTQDGIKGHIAYNQDMFDSATIERMAGHFRNLLDSLVADPNRPIDRLSLLGTDERERLLRDWNQTQMVYDRDLCLHQLFEAQAGLTPEATAVVFNEQSLTYRALNREANRLAHYLRDLDIGPGDIVGLKVPPATEMLSAMLAILKAGAAYLPLDHTLPEARRRFIISDAGLKAIVAKGGPKVGSKVGPKLGTRSGAAANIAEDGIIHIDLEEAGSDIVAYPANNPPCLAGPDHPAYVIYTSGSTGLPKGVQVSHRSSVNLLHTARERPGLNAGDTVLVLTTLTFDISLLEIFLPLLVGAKIILGGGEMARDGLQLAAFLEQTPVTFMFATPATWRMLLAAGWPGKAGLKILSGGEALSRDLADALLVRAESVWNAYGPTEATVYTTLHEVAAAGSSPVPIGRPGGNLQTYILDRHMEPVPVGVPGELYIGGDGVAQGYLNRLGLTAANFVPDPYGYTPGARLYKSGDLVRYRPDGTIDFLGRRDRQVKIRGFRIELGEIESWLYRHDQVAKAAVVAREEREDDWRLVAYVVPEPGQNLKASELVATLKGQLPGYMVPAAFVLMDSFPLTSRGKLDHQALPAPEWAGGGTGAADLAPRNATEERLVAIWMEVLGLEQVGLRDNFFDLGGHSLLAVRLLAKIEVEFETRIPLLTLLNEGTVEGLARMLGGGPSPAGRQAIVPLRSGHEARPLFVVTAGYGDLLALGQMAAQLPLGLPVFGLQPPGEGDGSPPVQDLAELTGHYVRAIREQQPEGPYRLAGYCSGGLVAFEVARQLTAGGDEVEPLILMESPRSLSRGSIAFYRRLRPVIARLIPGPNYDRFRPVAILRALFADQGLMAHLEALAGYRVANYPGQLTLILARWSHLRWFVGPRRWRRVAGRGLQVHIVPGDHDNFLRGPRSMSLAEKLTELIL